MRVNSLYILSKLRHTVKMSMEGGKKSVVSPSTVGKIS